MEAVQKPKPFRPLVLILLVAGGVVGMVLISRFVTPREVVPWRTDFAVATAEAKARSKPMLLDFSAEWCGPCQYMRHTTWADRRVALALDAYVPVKIDPDQHPDLVQRFKVSGFPTMLVVEGDGQVVKQKEEALLPDAFLDWLKS